MPSCIRAWKRTSNPFGLRNAAGLALYEKLGFEIEGTHRRFAFRNGRYADAYSTARVKG